MTEWQQLNQIIDRSFGILSCDLEKLYDFNRFLSCINATLDFYGDIWLYIYCSWACMDRYYIALAYSLLSPFITQSCLFSNNEPSTLQMGTIQW